MGASPEQLEREIEQTRESLSHTIGQIEERVGPAAIKNKLSPSRIVRENKQLFAVVGGGIAALMTLLVVRKTRRR